MGDLNTGLDSLHTEKNNKSLQIAMALSRWARVTSSTVIETTPPSKHISSREVEEALLGDGLVVNTTDYISPDALINVESNSIGIDKSIEIEMLEANRYLLKIMA